MAKGAIEKAVGETVIEVLFGGARRATKFIAPDLVVKACARFRPRKRSRITDMVVTVGKPNFRERAFIADCKKAGEPFPIARMRYDVWPAKRKAGS
jgi:hypothetical protein